LACRSPRRSFFTRGWSCGCASPRPARSSSWLASGSDGRSLDCGRERAFLTALGFTTAFATARGITHAIRAGVGPFRNISAGGTHIHHSTFGIFGLLGVGYFWSHRLGLGPAQGRRWPSRASATLYGVASALTLDEFALWRVLKELGLLPKALERFA
jgi:hypothetical protein